MRLCRTKGACWSRTPATWEQSGSSGVLSTALNRAELLPIAGNRIAVTCGCVCLGWLGEWVDGR
jgi:hypothetical protein